MANESSGAAKDVWDKLAALSAITAAVLVPIAVALVGNWYSAALKARETLLNEGTFKREWVQLGLTILRDANTTDNMRDWAVAIINFYSKDVPIPKAAEKDLTRNGYVLPPAAQSSAQTALPSTAGPPPPTSTERVASMNKLQTQGINALLERDLPGAIAAYDRAYETWPVFREVDEIRADLHKLSPPQNDQQWKAAYRALRKHDLRGVDPAALAKLQAAAQ